MIKKLLKFWVFTMAFYGCVYIRKVFNKQENTHDSLSHQRVLANYQLLTQWIENKITPKVIERYLKSMNCKNIAIYGMGQVGLLLYDYIQETEEIKVIYTIDIEYRSLPEQYCTIPMEKIPEMEMVDAIIITIPYLYENITSALCGITSTKTINILKLVCNH